MSSGKLSFSAEEILQSLDELDEETNLSFSKPLVYSKHTRSSSQKPRSRNRSKSKFKSNARSRSLSTAKLPSHVKLGESRSHDNIHHLKEVSVPSSSWSSSERSSASSKRSTNNKVESEKQETTNSQKMDDTKSHDYYADLQHRPYKVLSKSPSSSPVKYGHSRKNMISMKQKYDDNNAKTTLPHLEIENSNTADNNESPPPASIINLNSNVRTPLKKTKNAISSSSSASKSYATEATSPTTSITLTSFASPMNANDKSKPSSPSSASLLHSSEHSSDDDIYTLDISRDKQGSSATIFEYEKYDTPSEKSKNSDEDDSNHDGRNTPNGTKLSYGSHRKNSNKKAPADEKNTTQSNHCNPDETKNEKLEQNPTGMVISAPELQFAQEAILDPTWLDSLEEDGDEDDEYTDERNKTNDSNNQFVCKRVNEIGRSCTISTSTDTSSHSRCLSGDSFSDNLTTSSRSISFASSLSVGSCGFSKFSLTGSISIASSSVRSDNDIDDCSSSELSYADVVDMGLNTLNDTLGKNGIKSNNHTSETNSNSVYSGPTNELDRLYEIDYGSDEYDIESHSSREDAENDIHTTDIDKEGQKKDYLPTHLLTPPRVKRRSAHKSSSQFKDESRHIEEDEVKEEGMNGDGDEDKTKVYKNSSNKEEIIISGLQSKDTVDGASVDDVSIASSSNTDIHTNRSPSKPCSINQKGLAGIIRGDTIISILDCPGKRTRKKRNSKSKVSGMRRNKFSAGLADDFNWCEYSVELTLKLIRKLRNSETLTSDSLSYVDLCKSTVSPVGSGRSLMTSQSPDRNHAYNRKSPFSPKSPSPSKCSSSKKKLEAKQSPHQISGLEAEAIHKLEVRQ